MITPSDEETLCSGKSNASVGTGGRGDRGEGPWTTYGIILEVNIYHRTMYRTAQGGGELSET